MPAIETTIIDAFETTLTVTVGPTDIVYPVVTTGGGTSPMYLVFEPDSDAQREIVLCDGTFDGTNFRSTNVSKRYLTGSAAGSGLTHNSGTTVRCCPVSHHIADIYALITAGDIGTFVNAKGDLLVGTADDTVDNLPVGLAGLLVPDSTTITGLAWSNTVRPTSASATLLLLQLLATQTGSALVVKNSSGTTLLEIEPDGDLIGAILTAKKDSQILLKLNRDNATSRKGQIQWQRQGVDTWAMGPDSAGAGVQDFYLYDEVAAGYRLFVDASGNIGLMGVTTDFGSGAKVVGIRDAVTAPTGNPTTGSILYSSAQVLKVRDSEGIKTPFGREIVDAAGDLLVGDAADSIIRKAIGSETAPLVVDTTATGKIRWDNDAWATFTPTVTQSGSVTLSTATGRYQQRGKTIIGTIYCVASGSGTANNDVVIGGLPVAARTLPADDRLPVGGAVMRDTDVAKTYAGTATLHTTTSLVGWMGNNVANPMGRDPNFQIASGDEFAFSFTYEAA